MKITIGTILLSLSIGLSASASADNRMVDIEIVNLTNGTYFTPLLFAAHRPGFHLYQAGRSASASLQAMAEGGDLAGLIGEVTADGGNLVVDPADGLLVPGATATATLDVGRHARYLSAVAMLLPSNDGFAGLDGVRIPRKPGVYTFYLRGYDAATEANDELITGGGAPGAAGIPADPGGNSGSGGTGVSGPDHTDTIHVHRGVVGDLVDVGGPSDLDAATHRWLNPVAKITVTVGRPSYY